MKLLKYPQRKEKLQATTRRVAQPRGYEEAEPEPNMRLSSAFVVVLVLHLVAVGGIYAFNSIKAGRAPAGGALGTRKTAVAAKPASPVAQPAPVAHKAGETKPEARTKPAEAASHGAPAGVATDSGESYVVVKGDNPVSIAKRFGVSYAELLKLNGIDDPRRLQIGQKLHLPPKMKPGGPEATHP
jgi:LysM repeat protein